MTIDADRLLGVGSAPADDTTLESIGRRVLWLSTAIVDHANRIRGDASGIKVGGHQASSASMVTIMTALWFEHLQSGDRVSVKPHASPVLHAINYLLGGLDAAALTSLRQFGGLQSYPSRTKDPDPVDYSTGSVGIGATAPVWGGLARRYVESQFGTGSSGRQYSLVGDAELDEGAVWEAVLDPMVAGLGEVVWIVDLNRQSLDRVVPTIGAPRLGGMFEAAGWQVLTVKYGTTLERLFEKPGGDVLRLRIDEMSNAEYQRLLRCSPEQLRSRLPGGGPLADRIRELVEAASDATLHHALRNLGGHDLVALRRAFAAIDDRRPTVIFAYTIKGFGLPTAGHPQNHSALLNGDQILELAGTLGVDPGAPWEGFAEGTPEQGVCAVRAENLRRPPVEPAAWPAVPTDMGRTPTSHATTQAALGRLLLDLSRSSPEVAARVVTVSPDVSSSTNLGGWVNKVGVWSLTEGEDWFADDAETILHWREARTGRHVELGIAETNLVGLLGELGTTWSRWGEPLIPIGVMYDPFVERALEPWSFGIYAGGRSILIGTPSGVTLAPEGGAHQSIKTPSIGLEQPGCVAYEPAFVVDAEWTLLSAMAQLGREGGKSAYFRLSSRRVDQSLAEVPADATARARRRQHVVAGGYLLRKAETASLTVCAMGAVVTEALEAARRLAALGIGVDVVCVTSAGLLFEAAQARRRVDEGPTGILNAILAPERARPMVTVVDGHPHSLAFLAGVNCVPAVHLGVSGFGQSGNLEDVYAHHRLDADSIVRAGLDAIG